ncbi:MAG: SO2930 family diheme c-type cytochrome [Hyphomonas sp.]|uniref:SO2930 family diheme c-type cytochrome n=1 Tax=Hyphomonas sp. TaxID=87 RepID=UPI0035278AE9
MRHALALLPVLLVAACGGGKAGGPDLTAILDEAPAQHLSDYGFFADAAADVPAERVRAYDLINPLFSDDAAKHRYIFVPEGKTAKADGGGLPVFPVGTALIKTFAFAPDMRAPEEGAFKVETRVLIRKADGWAAYPYVWNADGTEATYAPTGARQTISTVSPAGEPLEIHYEVPNKNQCKTCHQSGDAVEPIGPKLRNLAHEGPAGVDQLADWAAAGLLDHVPDDLAPTPSAADMTLPLDSRARGYLDINCGHCHKPDGSASNSGLWLQLEETSPVKLGLKKHPTAAGRGSGGRLVVIEPGHPEQSILAYRMASTEPGIAMPELGRTLPDPVGIDLINQWIAGMEGE